LIETFQSSRPAAEGAGARRLLAALNGVSLVVGSSS
jgi:hypothetical protein